VPVYSLAGDRPDAAVEAVLDQPLSSDRTPSVVYSCLGYLIVGWTLERLLKTPLDVLFHERVAKPLGLAGRIGFAGSTMPQGPRAAGAREPTVERLMTVEWGGDPECVPSPSERLPDDGNARFLGGIGGNAGLFGTADAVVRLSAEFLPGGGSLLTADEARWATGIVTGGDEHQRSRGWQLAHSPGGSGGPALPRTGFGHTGFTGTSVWADPERMRVMALLMNRHHPMHRGVNLHPVRRRFHAIVNQH
jgi:CubicO group peptidase (beta-lactamase class C family)